MLAIPSPMTAARGSSDETPSADADSLVTTTREKTWLDDMTDALTFAFAGMALPWYV